MKTFQSVDELIGFAIQEEEAAATFYRGMAQKVSQGAMRGLFEEFAREEDGHKAKLQRIQKGDLQSLPSKKVIDLKIGDYLVDVEAKPDMTYQQALIVAMKKEKAAFRMYTDLASVATDPKIQELLLGLAQEEAKHKLRFEVEYDENILTEN